MSLALLLGCNTSGSVVLDDKGPGSIGFHTTGQLFLEEYYTLGLIAHGGIGCSWEADVHWLYKRAQLDAARVCRFDDGHTSIGMRWSLT